MTYFNDLKKSLPQTHQIVIQPTSFCNIDCSYCYLPNRNSLTKLSLPTLTNFLQKFKNESPLSKSIEIRWHAGEPLSINVKLFELYLKTIQDVLQDIQVKYTVQTNTLPINENWCKLFKDFNIEIGVSIDGPSHIHDRYRKSKKGAGTFKDVIKKIELLNYNSISFSTITVLTDYSLDYAKEIYDFMLDIKPTQIGFNIEETEGINKSNSLNNLNFLHRYKEFMKVLFYFHKDNSLKIREFLEIENAILQLKDPRKNIMVEAFKILTLDWNGNVSTFSPELISYNDFVFGNINMHNLNEVFCNTSLQSINKKIISGVNKCRKTCQYFDICGGGSPSNKYWENSSFNSTSTVYCTARFKIITDIILDYLTRSAFRE